MKIIELLLDEENEEMTGIEAVSIVESPAIESDFIALADQEIKLAQIDKDKRLLMGAALIPSKPIFRRDGEETYYVYFSKDTVRRASELFFMKGNQNNATLEHNIDVKNLSVVESWIVEGEQDKSRMYGLEVPNGTWVISMKIENDEIWNDYVKTGKVKGFSIEGYFADKAKIKQSEQLKEDEANIKLKEILSLLK